ncbi:sigma-70 family RNA polymerase sigma factor [Paenibacillus sp. H1-7]|uniref:sigma-70 family RNA polymerase sigma factor n=1 Tax=Paenibacillus sp. H1-7 TaxID=2282849 RepID=UPI001EF88914|nr:sigma-70 family RNA polymerase sigma factor [Paenibacillus sp. H1-7]ULL17524.1 sigma-70 family RNA polymerase sigma factor [Paenibacillus sp. H1-7]
MQTYTDEQLMQLIREKHSFALRMLYDRYVRLVYSFAVKSGVDAQLAHDIVQQVFTRIWVTEKGYDSGKGQFVNWLLTITRNMTIDHLRKQRNQQRFVSYEVITDSELGAGRPENCLQDTVSMRMLKDEIKSAYRYLSEKQIQLLRLFYWEGYTLSEIAESKGEPLGTVKNRLHQTLKTLRQHLKSYGEE